MQRDATENMRKDWTKADLSVDMYIQLQTYTYRHLSHLRTSVHVYLETDILTR